MNLQCIYTMHMFTICMQDLYISALCRLHTNPMNLFVKNAVKFNQGWGSEYVYAGFQTIITFEKKERSFFQ